MDKMLLLKFKECIKNNDAFFNKYRTNSGDLLLVSKWPYLNYFEIIHCDNDGKHIKNIYNHLYPFDCFNMIEELMVN